MSYSLALLYSVSLIILVLFAGALVGLLSMTAVAIHIVGSVLLAGQLPYVARGHGRNQMHLPLAVLVIVTGAFWIGYGDAKFYFYDEYSHGHLLQGNGRHRRLLDGEHQRDTCTVHARPSCSVLVQQLHCAHRRQVYVAQFVLLLTPACAS